MERGTMLERCFCEPIEQVYWTKCPLLINIHLFPYIDASENFSEGPSYVQIAVTFVKSDIQRT